LNCDIILTRIELIVDQSDKNELAELICLREGRQKPATAMKLLFQYFKAGLELLGLMLE